jgi:hypothetical protein
MAPTLRHGDICLMRRVRPGVTPPPGSVVVVQLPDRPLAVKRLTKVEPGGSVWVEGDNPFGSTDSRDLGAVPTDALRGRVLARIWPRPGHVRRAGGPVQR